MVGNAAKPVLRSSARTGDLIGITGVTGESAIGLHLLLEGIRTGRTVQKHKTVQPELEKGRILSKYVNAMIDVSDGLLIDLKRVLTASHKGAKIHYENIPVTREIKETCAQHQLDEYEMVLAGGEDYILLFTLSPQKEKELKKENIDYWIIGEINNNPGELTVDDRGKSVRLKTAGYDHFKHRHEKMTP
jgi:thiamine-monophosphate kinase